jgi:type IV secretion system protein VirD4
MKIVFATEKTRKLFLLVQCLIAAFAAWIGLVQGKTYQADELQITDSIKIPAPAGQGQNGSARFMSDKEKAKSFSKFELNPADSRIAELIRFGKKRKRDIPESEAVIESSFSERDWEFEQELLRIKRRKSERKAEIKEWFLSLGFVEKCVQLYTFFCGKKTKPKIKKNKHKPLKPPDKAKKAVNFIKEKSAETIQDLQHRRELSLYKQGRLNAGNPIAKPYSDVPTGVVIGLEKAGNCEKITCLDGDIHTLIIGATGCGKTRCLVIQTICLLALGGESIIASDPKGELFAYTEPFLRKLGYTVRVIDFQDTDKSHCLNPLQGVIDAVNENDTDTAQTRAWDLVCFLVERSEKGEPIWRNGEMSVLAAAVLCVVYDNKNRPQFQNLTNVYWFIANMCKDVPKENPKQGEPHTEKPIVEYVKLLPDDHPAKPLLGISEIAPDKTAGSFYTSALTTLRLFITKGVYNVTRKSDFRMDNSGREKEAFFYILPDENTTFYPVVTLMVSQQYEQLVKFAKSNGNRLPVRVNFVLDEFGNFAAISDFQAKMTVARGYGIRFNLFLQSLAQLTEKYGKEVAEIIKGNCSAWVYLWTQDETTNEEVSKQLGEYTTTSYSLGSSTQKYAAPSSSQNVNLVGRRLLFASELGRFGRPYQIVMTAGNPAVMYSPDLSKWLFNELLGLGSPKHNKRLIAHCKNSRPDVAKNDEPQELWGIWKKGALYDYETDLALDEIEKEAGERGANSRKIRNSVQENYKNNLPSERMGNQKIYQKEEKI